jgi:hypothetical protein
LEDVEGVTVQHFHIRWSGAKLDWEVFPTPEEAERQAHELKLPGETFTIEQFDGNCPQCSEIRKPLAKAYNRAVQYEVGL